MPRLYILSFGLQAIMLFGSISEYVHHNWRTALISYSSSPLPPTLAFVHFRHHDTHTHTCVCVCVYHWKPPVGKQKASAADAVTYPINTRNDSIADARIHNTPTYSLKTPPPLTLLKHFLHHTHTHTHTHTHLHAHNSLFLSSCQPMADIRSYMCDLPHFSLSHRFKVKCTLLPCNRVCILEQVSKYQ